MAARKKPAQPAAGRDMAAFMAALDKLQQMAIVLGAAAERARIAAIMNSESAVGRMSFAWEIAQSNLDRDAALKVLEVAKISSALPAIDAGAMYMH